MRRSRPDRPGITRRRCGRGWRYAGPDGAALDDETLARVRSLAVPPAWREVWICPQDNGHIQAIGVDDAGRRQYIYHERWRRERDEEKHDRVLALARRLPRFRAAIARDLELPGLPAERVVAGALRMLDRGVFRTGGEEYAEANGSRGVATLRREDVTLSGDELRFDFPAKSGVRRVYSMVDPPLARLVRSLRRTGSERLLVYRAGELREVRSTEVNVRFKELTGDEYTVKDLRTWHATVFAAAAFARAGLPPRKRVEPEVMAEVAEELGNTRAIARKSYVDVRVVEAYENGETVAAAMRRAERAAPEEARLILERAVLRLLR